MTDSTPPFFPPEEFERRVAEARRLMADRGLDACLISSPENLYYLTGLDHQGYFAYQALVLPIDGQPVFVSRAMEHATVRDQVPHLRHVGYSDGIAPVPAPRDREDDFIHATLDEEGDPAGLRPWEMSAGVAVRGPIADSSEVPVTTTVGVLRDDLGLAGKRIGLEERSAFFPYRIARSVVDGLPEATWVDISGMVEDVRIVQSPLELECTREAARISDAMLLAGVAAAGVGVRTAEVMAAIYDAMFRRGGTYPGFVPLVRSTRTLEHEHGTWQAGELQPGDVLFLEMAGCVRRYHAPIGRLVFIDHPTEGSQEMQEVGLEAMMAARDEIGPGVRAGDVYRVWQERVERAGLSTYRRHHCGYAVGIGYPPSWSGSGTPRGLRSDSELELREGMVFHLMSWLLRTGRGDSFTSDTIVVTTDGCELLTTASREEVCVRR